MHARTRLLLAALGATAALFASVGVVAAHDASFGSEVSIHFYDSAAPDPGPSRCGDAKGPDCFYGRVSSSRSACERGRAVKVFRKLDAPPPGRLQAAYDQLVGTAITDGDGRWVVATNDPGSNEYFARVSRRTIERAGHTHVCRAAESQVRFFEDWG